MRHLETTKPACRANDRGLQIEQNCPLFSRIDATPARSLQARRLMHKFGISPSVAEVLAEHAFQTQEARA